MWVINCFEEEKEDESDRKRKEEEEEEEEQGLNNEIGELVAVEQSSNSLQHQSSMTDGDNSSLSLVDPLIICTPLRICTVLVESD